MTNIKQNFLNNSSESNSKNTLIKKKLIRHLINNGCSTISELGNNLNLSVPTTTKFIMELMEEGFVIDFGKQNTNGGRKPNAFGLNPNAGYFIGVDIRHDGTDIAFIDFNGKIPETIRHIEQPLENTKEAIDITCNEINRFISEQPIPKEKIISIGLNLPGRVNPTTGESFTYFDFLGKPLAKIIEEKTGYPTTIDNDTKAMTYAEQIHGEAKDVKDMLYINFDWGIGLGIVIDGKLYYGKSGLSGEIGHHLTFNNEKICYCGKRGCLETEISGHALLSKLIESYKQGANTSLKAKLDKGEVQLSDIIDTVLKEDMLAIELLEKMANDLGRYTAGLINIFNPELLVLGGCVSLAGQYLSLPLTTAIKKNSLNLVNSDTEIKISALGRRAGIIGACMLTRSRVLGII